MMDNIDRFWETVGVLTYSEMTEIASQIRDAADSISMDYADAYSWAQAIEAARANHFEPE